MIQRIQTVYLLIVTVLQIFLMFSALATVSDTGGGEISIKTFDVIELAVLTGVTAVVSLVSIFLYKKRVLQARFNVFNALILIALQAYIIYYIVRLPKPITYSIPDIFPVISVIFTYLAIRNILKDEIIIKTLNRIR
jgi:hypothetical protein